MKKIVLILFTIVFVSCTKNNTDTPVEPNFTPVNITPVIVANGCMENNPNIFPNTGQNSVIDNQTDYSVFINKVIPRNLVTYEGSLSTTVNFTDKTVLTIVYNNSTDLNHKIIVDSVVENSNNIVVHYHEIDLNPATQLAAVIRLYIVLSIPKTTKPVVFTMT